MNALLQFADQPAQLALAARSVVADQVGMVFGQVIGTINGVYGKYPTADSGVQSDRLFRGSVLRFMSASRAEACP